MAADDGLTIVSDVVFPGLTNHHHTLFAGAALTLMTKAALVSASRVARAPMVMASVNRCDFLAPVPEGVLAEVTARVSERGTTSLTVLCELTSEQIVTGERRLCCTASFTMVTVGADGRPAPGATPGT
jgi:acyl-CoA hydrolase